MENWGAKQAGCWVVCWACWGSRGPGLCAQSEPGWILIRQQAAAERSEKSCRQIQISGRDKGGRRPLSQVCLSNSSCLSSCDCLKNSLIVLFMPPILWFNSLKSEKFKRIKLLKHPPHSGQQQTPAISGVVASRGGGEAACCCRDPTLIVCLTAAVLRWGVSPGHKYTLPEMILTTDYP